MKVHEGGGGRKARPCAMNNGRKGAQSPSSTMVNSFFGGRGVRVVGRRIDQKGNENYGSWYSIRARLPIKGGIKMDLFFYPADGKKDLGRKAPSPLE